MTAYLFREVKIQMKMQHPSILRPAAMTKLAGVGNFGLHHGMSYYLSKRQGHERVRVQ